MTVSHESRQIVSGLPFPEGPRWHAGALWFSDIIASTVNRVVPGEDPQLVVTLDDRPSGLGFMPDGSLLIVSMHRRQLLSWSNGELSVHADLSSLPGEFLNDMVVDLEGRAYVGSRTTGVAPDRFDASTGGPDCLIAVEPDGQASIAADDLCAPNGTVISPDSRTLIVAETYGRRLSRFDRDTAGRLSGRTTFGHFDSTLPDGIALDEEGAVWVSSPYSNEVVQIFPDGCAGLRLSIPGAVACTFGEADRRTLFVLTVDRRLLPTSNVPSDFPLPTSSEPAGGIFAVNVGTAGAGLP